MFAQIINLSTFLAITSDLKPRIFGQLEGTNYVMRGDSLTLYCAAAGK